MKLGHELAISLKLRTCPAGSNQASMWLFEGEDEKFSRTHPQNRFLQRREINRLDQMHLEARFAAALEVFFLA